MQNRILTIVLLVLLAALLPSPAHAMTADEYFADGNRLAREDLYWAALLRYGQAAEQGLDTPLLHYNTGVTHYQAGQHIRAREALLKALADPTLRVATHYNLGLNAWALGDTDEALRWFRLARDQESNPKLQKFAVVAIARIRMAQEVPTEYEVIVEERQEKRAFTDLRLRARLGYGNDSNIFRSPDQPYIDLADPAQPVVVPEVQSGAYVPLNLSAQYMINSLPFEGFYGAYRLAGRYYTDELYENGNEYLHQLSFGSEFDRYDEEKNRERYVHSAFAIAQKDEVYYDPDDGLARDIGGVVVDDRMNYVRFGPELTARQSGERLSFGINFKGQLWNYEDIEVLPEYDHEYFRGRLYGQFKFTSTSLLRVTASYYSRRYGDRPAYDLDGVRRVGNPNIRYDYVALGLRARQRITSNMWFGFDVERAERTDQYVGYNDYTRDSFGFEFHWSPGRRFDIEVDGVYRLYDYPNAFAFHEPTAGRKTQESLDARLEASYWITRNLSIVAEAELREVVSNDIRIQYDRTHYLIGVRWEQ
jgi:tetratricopeptide (TPR) repeat protein